MATKILKGGVKRIVQVLAKNLKARLDDPTSPRLPLIGVRVWSDLDKLYTYRQVDILGESSIMELEEALPNTDGRGICPLITEAPLRVYLD